MKVVSVSDTGLVRTNNEDCLSVFSVGKDECFVIADGMGGHAAGELASKTAVEYVTQSLNEYLFEADDAQKLQKLLAFTLEKANVKVYLASLGSFRYRGMGTTLTVAVLRDKTLYISHIGDCRVYLLHGQRMKTLTTDHTLVQRMVDNGITGFIDSAFHHWSPEAYVTMDIRTTLANTGRAAVWETMDSYGDDRYCVSWQAYSTAGNRSEEGPSVPQP